MNVLPDVAVAALRDGELVLAGRLPGATNASFRGEVTCDGLTLPCVYKPSRGERPLADFPPRTLAQREAAAYLVSEAGGWGIVPPTAMRAEGPFGAGMAQLWVEVDDRADVLELLRERAAALRRVALFDVVANNADRKVGHLLPTADGAVLGCDHGICFASEPKLRTVLWDWAGERLDDEERATLGHLRARLHADLGDALRELLSEREIRATARRVERLLETGVFPEPLPGRPSIPWPPF